MLRSSCLFLKPVIMAIVITLAALFFCLEANAGEVRGKVYIVTTGNQNISPANVQITITRGDAKIKIQLDGNGNFRVFLAPGTYQVSCHYGDRDYKGTLRSYHTAVRQNIILR